MSNENDNKYVIPKYLNRGKSLFGLPLDQGLPAAVIFVLLFMAKHQMVGLCLAVGWFFGLGFIKLQYGQHIIALAFYWWGDASANKTFFKRTPAAFRRYWLS